MELAVPNVALRVVVAIVRPRVAQWVARAVTPRLARPDSARPSHSTITPRRATRVTVTVAPRDQIASVAKRGEASPSRFARGEAPFPFPFYGRLLAAAAAAAGGRPLRRSVARDRRHLLGHRRCARHARRHRALGPARRAHLASASLHCREPFHCPRLAARGRAPVISLYSDQIWASGSHPNESAMRSERSNKHVSYGGTVG